MAPNSYWMCYNKTWTWTSSFVWLRDIHRNTPLTGKRWVHSVKHLVSTIHRKNLTLEQLLKLLKLVNHTTWPWSFYSNKWSPDSRSSLMTFIGRKCQILLIPPKKLVRISQKCFDLASFFHPPNDPCCPSCLFTLFYFILFYFFKLYVFI